MILAAAQGGILDFTLANNDLIDFTRYLTALLGLVVALLALVRFMAHELKWPAIACGGIGFITTLQQVEALGTDFYPWRLPLLVGTNIAAAIYLYQEPPNSRLARRTRSPQPRGPRRRGRVAGDPKQ